MPRCSPLNQPFPRPIRILSFQGPSRQRPSRSGAHPAHPQRTQGPRGSSARHVPPVDPPCHILYVHSPLLTLSPTALRSSNFTVNPSASALAASAHGTAPSAFPVQESGTPAPGTISRHPIPARHDMNPTKNLASEGSQSSAQNGALSVHFVHLDVVSRAFRFIFARFSPPFPGQKAIRPIISFISV